jgi:hypothetical protein
MRNEIMSDAISAEVDFAQDRQRQIAEMVGDSGGEWAREFRPGTAGCHELLDRTAMFAEMIQKHLASHPACLANAEWHQLVHQAMNILHELYQRIGAEHLAAEL